MLYELREQFAQQATIGPVGRVLETGDQAVDRETVGPGRDHLCEGRRGAQALATDQAAEGQGQCADRAMFDQPGQFGFTGLANGLRGVGGVVAESKQCCVFFNQM